MNLNPRNEDAQDFRSRLNFKRGSLTLSQPGFSVYAFDSENLQTWDDPFKLVGGIGQYDHPFGYQRQGFQVRTPQRWTVTEGQALQQQLRRLAHRDEAPWLHAEVARRMAERLAKIYDHVLHLSSDTTVEPS